jgi:endonuclease/exonuclease/phosphatase (EEP) superfamily protein YafD
VFKSAAGESIVSLKDSRYADPDIDDAELADLKRKKPRHRQWGQAIFLVLAGIAGLVAGRLGQLYPIFDVFSQLGVQFMALALASSLALVFGRYKAIYALAFTITLLIFYGAWPHLVSAPLQKGPYVTAANERILRVAQYNTYKNNADVTAIANEVLRLDADVITLIETSRDKMKALTPLLSSKYPNFYYCQSIGYCELAIFSKFPLLNATGLGEPSGPSYVRASLGGEMSGVTVFGVHTTRFPHPRQHLRQMQDLVKLVESVSGDVLVMGDFNATPLSRLTTTLEEGASLSRLTDLPTWPTLFHLPQLAIDHIFASGNFRVVGNQQIGEAAGSDHYPIVLTLARDLKN